MKVGTKSRGALAAVGLMTGALILSACSSIGGGSSGGGGAGTEITFLGDNSDATVQTATAMVNAFNATNSGVTVKFESRPGGADGDNAVKTKLATGDMSDVFMYNSGSLLQAIDPAKNLIPLTGEAFMANVQDSFKPAVTSGAEVYGVPFGQAMGGGILYNKKIFDDLSLTVPTTWDEFMANNAKIKAAGIAPVIQTYADTWTSQLFVLADFHNIQAQVPDWADKYTLGQEKYVDQPAQTSFQRLQEVYDAGYLNKDFASLKFEQGLHALATGKGAQYPMLTFAVGSMVTADPDAAQNVGFFAQPGPDAATNGLTTWTPAGIYIPTTTTGEKLDAVKKFLTWVATPPACDAQTSAVPPTGPYMIKGCTLPSGLPLAVTDLQKYFDGGNNSPALEFLSPVKGPNLEKITVEVGSGITSAEAGAALYDKDVKKQAQQLGLPGW